MVAHKRYFEMQEESKAVNLKSLKLYKLHTGAGRTAALLEKKHCMHL